MSKVVKFSNQT